MTSDAATPTRLQGSTLLSLTFAFVATACSSGTSVVGDVPTDPQPAPPIAPPAPPPANPPPPADPPPTPPVLIPALMFRDVSIEAGIVDKGISFGISVGDMDGDQWPDIYTSGHFDRRNRLWRNRGDGTFELMPTSTLMPAPDGDLHAAQWADLDNDGRDELTVLTGACFGTCESGNYCYYHQNGGLVDRAAAVGVEALLMRGRTPLAVDTSRDSRLDLMLTAPPRPDGMQGSELFEQQPDGTFGTPGASQNIDLASASVQFGILGDLNGDDRLDACFATLESDPLKVYSVEADSVTEITADLGLHPAVLPRDAVIADLTGDGQNEIYVARHRFLSGYHVRDDGALEVKFILNGATPQSITVRPGDDPTLPLTVSYGPVGPFSADDTFLGAAGAPASSNDLSLFPADALGLPVVTPGVSEGLFIGWDEIAEEWVFTFSTTSSQEGFLLFPNFATEASGPIDTTFPAGTAALSDPVLALRDGNYDNVSASLGLAEPRETRSVVAADFDNDMDLDLYLVVGTATNNEPNVLMENQGDGTFIPVAAPGSQGPTAGIGDTVATLDYDRDGRMDLLLTNGPGARFRFQTEGDAFSDDGPTSLLRNETISSNHWIGIHLTGTTSNRSAIGAKVYVTTSDGRIQSRELSGGMHRYTQNERTLHFGLGPHTTVDLIEVVWPDTPERSFLTNIVADRYITILE